jgi:hypothetical protein
MLWIESDWQINPLEVVAETVELPLVSSSDASKPAFPVDVQSADIPPVPEFPYPLPIRDEPPAAPSVIAEPAPVTPKPAEPPQETLAEPAQNPTIPAAGVGKSKPVKSRPPARAKVSSEQTKSGATDKPIALAPVPTVFVRTLPPPRALVGTDSAPPPGTRPFAPSSPSDQMLAQDQKSGEDTSRQTPRAETANLDFTGNSRSLDAAEPSSSAAGPQ